MTSILVDILDSVTEGTIATGIDLATITMPEAERPHAANKLATERRYWMGFGMGAHLLVPARPAPKSWKPEVQANSAGINKWSGNAVRTATVTEAQEYVHDLMMRWVLVTATRVVPSPDPVTATFIDGRLTFLPHDPATSAEDNPASHPNV